MKPKVEYTNNHQHTPGPWQATTGLPPMSYYVTHQETQNGKHNSYMVCAVGDSPVAEADARLIAAAPEMLAILKGMLASLPQGTLWPVGMSDTVVTARALIAKIEGKG